MCILVIVACRVLSVAFFARCGGIVVSADATQKQIDRLITAGASDYLTKPVDINRFLQIVQIVPPHGGITEEQTIEEKGENVPAKEDVLATGTETGSPEPTVSSRHDS